MSRTPATTAPPADSRFDKYRELLPRYIAHLKEVQARCLDDGFPLMEHEVSWARQCGVREPDKVRVLEVATIDVPIDEDLRQAEFEVSQLTGRPYGDQIGAVCMGHGIQVRDDQRRFKQVMVHELAHVAQHERIGGIEAVTAARFEALLKSGYKRAPWELEAEATVRRLFLPNSKAWADARYEGIPWKRGGRGWDGIDCIGLIELLVREEFDATFEVPDSPVAWKEIDAATPLFLPRLKPEEERGDTLFFRHRRTGLVTHFCPCLGNGKILNITVGTTSRIENSTALISRLGYEKLGAIGYREAQSILAGGTGGA